MVRVYAQNDETFGLDGSFGRDIVRSAVVNRDLLLSRPMGVGV
jgi:hypothetical protein